MCFLGLYICSQHEIKTNQEVKMAAECSHQDETRKGVSSTAHGVASLRAMEAQLDPSVQLFSDPYATILGGEVGQKFINLMTERVDKTPYALIDGLAVRTKRIDDEVRECRFSQICVPGAGLDARPWRLKKPIDGPVHYYEVDFPEIFNFKLNALKGANATTEYEYHSVNTDLSLDSWCNDLIAAGFDVTQPTLFIMEGLINYLTKEEADSLFTKITTILAARGSKLIMTCMTPSVKSGTDMHRFKPEVPIDFVTSHGWTGYQEEINAIGIRFNRVGS